MQLSLTPWGRSTNRYPLAPDGVTPTPDVVRDAGPEHMENPPRRWDPIDQQADESFPASDPPGNY
ncbi:MAG: hypothetical protein WDM79_15555 [Terricaulis sp.]